MKNLLIAASVLAMASGAYAQGFLIFNDGGSTAGTGHIYGPQASGQRVSGNVSVLFNGGTARFGDTPVGNTTYTPDAQHGGLVGGEATDLGDTYHQRNGNAYSVELAGVPGDNQTVTTANLIPASLGTLNTTHNTKTTGSQGLFGGSGATGVPGTTAGGSASCVVYAWYNGGGAFAAYSDAVAAGVPSGFSDPFNVDGLDASTGTPPTTVFKSFSLTASPEPSTIALGLIGASSFLFRRRK